MSVDTQNSDASVMVAARVPLGIAAELRALAGLNDRSMSAELRVALRAHITNGRGPSVTSGLRQTDEDTVRHAPE